MVPNRYLIASLFIAAMLLVLAVVQGRRTTREGGVATDPVALAMSLDAFETVAELRLEEGWTPRFQGGRDPDETEPWPFEAGFGAPWEPASPYLDDQGLALNGPQGHSQVALWQGLEWRRYRFDAPLVSARLDNVRGRRLLVTLQMGPGRYQTRLLEVPEGRELWVVDSGPWSRFSWDGRAALVGLDDPDGAHLLLTALPLEGDLGERSLAGWGEPGLPAPARGTATVPERLWADGQDLPGARIHLPREAGDAFWFPRRDRLWVQSGSNWARWTLDGEGWRREEAEAGVLVAQPPARMGRVRTRPEGGGLREVTPADRGSWEAVPEEAPAWPARDPAWVWTRDGGVLTAWDTRWQEPGEALSPERQRAALSRAYRPDWITASRLRASVQVGLPKGPEVVLREADEAAWVWLGDRVLLVRLQSSERHRRIRKILTG